MELKLSHPSEQELFLTDKELAKLSEMGRTYPQ
jgi:hypothetical protein